MLCTNVRTEFRTRALFPIIRVSSSSITSVSSESVMDGQVSSLALGFGWFGDDAGLVDLAVTLAGSAGLVGVVCFAGNVDLVGKVFLVCLVGVVGMRKPLSIHPWGSRTPEELRFTWEWTEVPEDLLP